ncbi:MAG: four helix bundle protein [Bacteroidota bacterium]
MGLIKRHQDLDVYWNAVGLASELYSRTTRWPKEEQRAMTDQVRRASRSVCSNLAEAWGRRAYVNSFRAKIVDAISEACETSCWIDLAAEIGYLNAEEAKHFSDRCEHIISQLHAMRIHAKRWSYNAS